MVRRRTLRELCASGVVGCVFLGSEVDSNAVLARAKRFFGTLITTFFISPWPASFLPLPSTRCRRLRRCRTPPSCPSLSGSTSFPSKRLGRSFPRLLLDRSSRRVVRARPSLAHTSPTLSRCRPTTRTGSPCSTLVGQVAHEGVRGPDLVRVGPHGEHEKGQRAVLDLRGRVHRVERGDGLVLPELVGCARS